VHAACDYRKPLRFEDLVEIHLLVAEKRSKSIRYQMQFHRLFEDQREEVAVGMLTVVCVRQEEDGVMKAVALPADLAAQIQVAPKEMLVQLQS
jgi:acyl-CoA thioesterase FadM